jgi:hypothetical protein
LDVTEQEKKKKIATSGAHGETNKSELKQYGLGEDASQYETLGICMFEIPVTRR